MDGYISFPDIILLGAQRGYSRQEAGSRLLDFLKNQCPSGRLQAMLKVLSDGGIVLRHDLAIRPVEWQNNPWEMFGLVSPDLECSWQDHEEDPHESMVADLGAGTFSAYLLDLGDWFKHDVQLEHWTSSYAIECHSLSLPINDAHLIMSYSPSELEDLIRKWPKPSRSRDLFWTDVLSKDPRRGTWGQDDIRKWPEEEWNILRPAGKRGRPRARKAQ